MSRYGFLSFLLLFDGFIGFCFLFFFFFFFNDTATTEIYTLSLHDALPILLHISDLHFGPPYVPAVGEADRKSTRLNSSHTVISYAVFCLKKKKKKQNQEESEKRKRKEKNKGEEDRKE